MTEQPLKIITGLLFPLLVFIALFSIFEYKQFAASLMDVNIILIGLYFIYSINLHLKLLSQMSLSIVILAVLFVDVQNINYQLVLFLNLSIVVLYISANLITKNFKQNQYLIYIFSIPFIFTLIDVLSTSNVNLNQYSRNLWDAAFISTGVWLLAKHHLQWLNQHAHKWILSFMLLYSVLLVQFPISSTVLLPPIYLWAYALDYGNSIPTSHLSIYAAIVLVTAIYLFNSKSWIVKFLCTPIIAVTSLFILYTSWRPVWLGLVLGAFIAFILCYPKRRKVVIAGMVLLQVILLVANVGHYKERMFGLWKERKTEERNIIWQDAWQMQLATPAKEWVLGHGLNSYQDDFKAYSRFYKNPQQLEISSRASTPVSKPKWLINQWFRDALDILRIFRKPVEIKQNNTVKMQPTLTLGIAYESPHNLILYMLYATGVVGLLLVVITYYFAIFNFTKLSQARNELRALSCAMLVASICTLVIVGLNLVFFKHYNLIPMAYIFGVLLYLQEYKEQLYSR